MNHSANSHQRLSHQAHIVDLVRNGATIAQTAAHTRLSISTINRWRKTDRAFERRIQEAQRKHAEIIALADAAEAATEAYVNMWTK